MNQVEASYLKQLGVYGNVTKTHLLINEYMKGRDENLTVEEESIVTEVNDRINGASFVEQSHQKCQNLFMSVSFRGSRIVWNEDHEDALFYYPTDFGSCCLLIPHHLKPYDKDSPYHGLRADALNGEANGVDIVLDADQFNYAYHYSNAGGFKISMHNHLDKPMIQFSSQLIYPGQETQINLKPIISNTTIDAINNFSPEDRNCYADGEANLTYLKYNLAYRYEMNNCLVDRCITDIILNCQCLPQLLSSHDLMSNMKTDSICSGQKLYCAQKIEETLGLQHSDVCLI